MELKLCLILIHEDLQKRLCICNKPDRHSKIRQVFPCKAIVAVSPILLPQQLSQNQYYYSLQRHKSAEGDGGGLAGVSGIKQQPPLS